MSAILCCVYLQLGLAQMYKHPIDHNGYWVWDINQVVNPYGTIEIGYQRVLGKHFDVKFDLHHISSIPVNDFGTNTTEIAVLWFPWRSE